MKLTKKAFSLLLACIMLFTLLPAFPALASGTPIEGTHVRWRYDAGTKTLSFTGYGPMPDYDLNAPPNLPWHDAVEEIETVVFSNGITAVGDGCFPYLPALRRAAFPESLLRIGAANFYCCKNLTDAALPEGLLFLGEHSFCLTGMTRAEIPAGVKTLEYAFNMSPDLTEVVLHEGLERIEESFSYSPLESLELPASLISITGCEFIGLKKLVNRSLTAVAHEQMDSIRDPADRELLLFALRLECELNEAYFAMLLGGQTEPAEPVLEQLTAEAMEKARLWLNETYGVALETPEDVIDYFEAHVYVTGAPAPDAEIYCVSGSAEDKALDKTSIPHYLIDRDNALCDRPPEWSGTAGEHITWNVDAATGTLTFTGYGDANDVLNAGYHRLSDIITSVEFECTEGPITFIGDSAFEGLENLTELTLPQGLTALGENIIKNSGVRVLTLPGTMNDVYSHSLLLGTTPLQRIELSGESDILFTEHGALYYYRSEGIEGTTLCKLPAEAVGYPLNDDLVQIMYYAVEGFSDMTTFTIPGTVKYLNGDVFYDLPALETVILEPGEDALRTFFSADDFGGSTKVPSFVVSEDDERFFVRDGVLYDKPLMQVRMVPGDMTSLDLAEDIKSIYTYVLRWGDTFDRITVRGDDFDFFTDSWRDSPVSYIDENTVIVCRRGSEAESYALRFGCGLEYLEDVTVTAVDIIADGPIVVYQNEDFDFKDLSVHAEVLYSDGTTRTFPARDLFYVTDDYDYARPGSSGDNYWELKDHDLTVKFGGVSKVFTLSVVPSPVTYRFDLSEINTDFVVWEEIGETSLNAKLLQYDPRTDTESEISIYNASLYLWNGTDWTSDCCFTEPGPCRMKLEYRGAAQEFTVNVSTDEYLFTTNADEAVTEVPQFAVYTKAYGGNRLFVTHNGETTEITEKLTVCANKRMQSIYSYDFEYPDTTVPGNSTYWLCASYYVYGTRTTRSRSFRVMMPLEVTVVTGDVVDAYLDISDVPEYVPAARELTAGELGIKVVKTMADGSVQIDEDPDVFFNWIYMPGSYAGETLYTWGNGAIQYVTAHYGALTAKFTVVTHAHKMTYVPAAASADCRMQGNIDHWHCTACGRNFADEAASTELENVWDGITGPHAPIGEYAGFAPTCTEEGLIPYYVCAVCFRLTDANGNLLADPLLPAGHVYEWVDEIAPTCTEPGIVGHYTCTLCGANFDGGKAPLEELSIAPLGHTPGMTQIENVDPPTCIVAGAYDEVVFCAVCYTEIGRTRTLTPAVGHDWGEWEVVKQATVSEEGLMRRVCRNDDSHVEEEIIPKLQPQTNAFRRFIQRIVEFFNNIVDWFRRLFRF